MELQAIFSKGQRETSGLDDFDLDELDLDDLMLDEDFQPIHEDPSSDHQMSLKQDSNSLSQNSNNNNYPPSNSLSTGLKAVFAIKDYFFPSGNQQNLSESIEHSQTRAPINQIHSNENQYVKPQTISPEFSKSHYNNGSFIDSNQTENQKPKLVQGYSKTYHHHHRHIHRSEDVETNFVLKKDPLNFFPTEEMNYQFFEKSSISTQTHVSDQKYQQQIHNNQQNSIKIESNQISESSSEEMFNSEPYFSTSPLDNYDYRETSDPEFSSINFMEAYSKKRKLETEFRSNGYQMNGNNIKNEINSLNGNGNGNGIENKNKNGIETKNFMSPEELFKAHPIDEFTTSEDILRMLNDTFVQKSESLKKKIDPRRNLKIEGIEDKELEKKLKKREIHANVERKRRDNINECIAEFAKMVPDLQEQTKLNKGAILRKSVEYLEELQERTLKLEDQLQLALEQWRTTHHKCTQLMAHLSSSNEKMANLEKENQLLKEMIQVENQMKFSDYDENEGENGTQLKNTNHSQVLDSMKGFL